MRWAALAVLTLATPALAEQACPFAQYVTLPSAGYRLATGEFVGMRQLTRGTQTAGAVNFVDAAGKTRCLKPIQD